MEPVAVKVSEKWTDVLMDLKFVARTMVYEHHADDELEGKVAWRGLKGKRRYLLIARYLERIKVGDHYHTNLLVAELTVIGLRCLAAVTATRYATHFDYNDEDDPYAESSAIGFLRYEAVDGFIEGKTDLPTCLRSISHIICAEWIKQAAAEIDRNAKEQYPPTSTATA